MSSNASQTSEDDACRETGGARFDVRHIVAALARSPATRIRAAKSTPLGHPMSPFAE